jgi:sugar lactone lactonase YvrE
VDSAGNVYVADTVNSTIRKMTPVGTNWVVTTLAGLAGCTGTNDGTGSAARFYYPNGVAVDSAGNIYVADSGNHTIREVTPVGTDWVVTTLAGLAGSAGGANGTNSAARFNYPAAVAVDTNGNVYVADSGNNTIRKVTPAGVVTTLAGLASNNTGSTDGTGSAARFNGPANMAVDTNGNVYLADSGNNTIREVTPAGVVTTLAGLAGHAGSTDGTNSAARFNLPYGVAVDSAGNLYVADTLNYTIRKVTPVGTNWVVTTLAGAAGVAGSADGTNSAARFNGPADTAVDTNGNVYVTDFNNDTIRKVTPAGVVTTLAGLVGSSGSADGTGSAARFYAPIGVAVDKAGNVYVTEYFNYTIREVTPVGTNWVVTTLAGLAGSIGSVDGTNRAARFSYPASVAVDTNGNLYVADDGDSTIRQVTPVGTNWVVTTLAGLAGYIAEIDGTGSGARFNNPFAVAVDMAGNVYVGDFSNSTIRKGFPASSVPAPVLEPPSLSAGLFGFGITGLPGLPVNIESSGDLAQWQVVGTGILVGGTNYYSVNPNPAQAAQFYRTQVR